LEEERIAAEDARRRKPRQKRTERRKEDEPGALRHAKRCRPRQRPPRSSESNAATRAAHQAAGEVGQSARNDAQKGWLGVEMELLSCRWLDHSVD
jgi:hypothetical protein